MVSFEVRTASGIFRVRQDTNCWIIEPKKHNREKNEFYYATAQAIYPRTLEDAIVSLGEMTVLHQQAESLEALLTEFREFRAEVREVVSKLDLRKPVAVAET